MNAKKRTTRRVGMEGQLDFQSRSHDGDDCGRYRLIEKLDGPGHWRVELLTECDRDWRTTMDLTFISREKWDRYF